MKVLELCSLGSLWIHRLELVCAEPGERLQVQFSMVMGNAIYHPPNSTAACSYHNFMSS